RGGSTSGKRDTTPPSVAITAPAGGTSVSGMVTISGTASDNSGVASVAVSVDGGAFSMANGTQSWREPYDTTHLSNGHHPFTRQATDTAGNPATSSVTLSVSNSAPAPVDSVAPSVSIGTPLDGASL